MNAINVNTSKQDRLIVELPVITIRREMHINDIVAAVKWGIKAQPRGFGTPVPHNPEESRTTTDHAAALEPEVIFVKITSHDGLKVTLEFAYIDAKGEHRSHTFEYINKLRLLLTPWGIKRDDEYDEEAAYNRNI